MSLAQLEFLCIIYSTAACEDTHTLLAAYANQCTFFFVFSSEDALQISHHVQNPRNSLSSDVPVCSLLLYRILQPSQQSYKYLTT